MQPTLQVSAKCILKNPRGWRTYHVVKNGLSTRLSQICKYIVYMYRISSKHPTIDSHNLCSFPSEWLHYLALPVNNSAILCTLGCKSVAHMVFLTQLSKYRRQLGIKRGEHVHRRKLTARPWKMTVGRWSFPFGFRPLFRFYLTNSGEYVLKPPPTWPTVAFWRSYMQKETLWHIPHGVWKDANLFHWF